MSHFTCKLSGAVAEPVCDKRYGMTQGSRGGSQGSEMSIVTCPQTGVFPHTHHWKSDTQKQLRREKTPYGVQPNVHSCSCPPSARKYTWQKRDMKYSRSVLVHIICGFINLYFTSLLFFFPSWRGEQSIWLHSKQKSLHTSVPSYHPCPYHSPRPLLRWSEHSIQTIACKEAIVLVLTLSDCSLTILDILTAVLTTFRALRSYFYRTVHHDPKLPILDDRRQ